MIDGQVAIACAEERLTRKKYANGWWTSFRYCLDAVELRLEDIDLVVFSNAGPPLPEDFDAGLSRWTRRIRTAVVDHHVSHATSAFVLTGYPEALVVVADAGGNDRSTETVFHVSQRHIDVVRKSDPGRLMAAGLGPTYEAFTNFLGFTDEESGKTMGLAAFGDPEAFDLELFEVSDDGFVESLLRHPHLWGVRELGTRTGIELGEPFPDSRSQRAQDIAALIQTRFTRAMKQMLEATKRLRPDLPIVLSGGTSLNCTANSWIRSTGLDLFASPLGSDTGLALGNAAYGQFILDGFLHPLMNTSLRYGGVYSAGDIELALARVPQLTQAGPVRRGELQFRREDDPVSVAAQAILDDQIVAWWQGRSELGPRALGGRSLVASPKSSDIRERMNRQVKQREWFRPFGPSLLDSNARSLLRDDPRHLRYMNEAPAVEQVAFDDLVACVHVDGSARAQTIPDESDDRYAALLRVLSTHGLPAVLNTSFNIQEPIVESPSDAISTFLRSEIDLLILGDYVCTRVVP